MNCIIAVCQSFGRDGLEMQTFFLKFLSEIFTMKNLASTHVLHSPAISHKDFPVGPNLE
jgi:hypothetical protein